MKPNFSASSPAAPRSKIEKRLLLRSLPRFSQQQADALIRLLEDERKEQERQNALDPQRRQGYERVREKELAEWRELEREFGR